MCREALVSICTLYVHGVLLSKSRATPGQLVHAQVHRATTGTPCPSSPPSTADCSWFGDNLQKLLVQTVPALMPAKELSEHFLKGRDCYLKSIVESRGAGWVRGAGGQKQHRSVSQGQ